MADVALSSLDKVMWPAAGFTKGEMLDYYERVAPVLLPHIAGRPLTLGRFPEGVDGPGFAQTECRGRPDWIATVPIRLRDGRTRNYCVVNDLRSLVWVANLGTIELHPFLARGARLDEPAVVLFDLDPVPPATAVDCARVALLVREALAARGLSASAKTSGAAGIHVVVPLNSPHRYDVTRAFARDVAEEVAACEEGVVARASRRDERAGAVLVDWAQNSERRSTVAPYSLRATYRPSVSTPVAWGEVEETVTGGRALEFGPGDVLERIERHGDLFETVLRMEQAVPAGGQSGLAV